MNYTRTGLILVTEHYEECIDFYTRILELSFSPEQEEANRLLNELTTREKLGREAQRKKRQLKRIVDNLNNPRRTVSTREIHEMLNEINRDEVTRDWLEWIGARIEAAGSSRWVVPIVAAL